MAEIPILGKGSSLAPQIALKHYVTAIPELLCYTAPEIIRPGHGRLKFCIFRLRRVFANGSKKVQRSSYPRLVQ
jgi:hypothetical protein